MMQTVSKLLRDCLTENDGASYCPLRVAGMSLALPSVVIFLAGGAVAISVGKFDPQQFASAFTTMMGGFGLLGLGVAGKALTDKQQ